MEFFAALAALLLEHFRPLRRPLPHYEAFAAFAAWLEARFNAGGTRPGALAWGIAILSVLAGTWTVWALLSGVHWFFGWLWSVAVLYATLGFRYYAHDAETISAQLHAGETAPASDLLARWRNAPEGNPLSESDCARLTVEQTLIASHRQMFAPLLCFVVLAPLGPIGSVLYRAASILARRWEGAPGLFGDFARRAFHVVNWLPARATALSFAIAGNFEDAMYSWRTQAPGWSDAEEGVVLAAGAGAMNTLLGGGVEIAGQRVERPELGQGGEADADLVDGALGLIWRAVVIWLVLGALFVVAGWF